MKARLAEVTEENWRDCVKLEVAKSEKHYVDRNVFALAEWKFEPENKVRAIYSESELVGMLAHYYHDGAYGKFHWLYHLMIEPKHQGKGIGQKAVKLAIKEMRDLGAKEIVTSYHPANIRAKHIYEKLGFKDNGVLEGGDPFLILATSA